MSRCISILGSTGSIGRQSLEVIAACGMTCGGADRQPERRSGWRSSARRFRPELAVLMDEDAAADLQVRLADTEVRVAAGMEGLLEAAALPGADTVLTAVVGMVGLRPTLAAIREGKRIALANKETLVCARGAGDVGRRSASGAEILPVDSEHSALFQCLQGCRDRGEVKRLILTCSGGPFLWAYGRRSWKHVTREDALQHPNWSMGAKITVDSATLMNKGLEFIEAMRLYHMPPEKISIVIHRESIIHSLVEYCDNAMIAQLGTPDMRLPIQYALTWPERIPGPWLSRWTCWTCRPLTFGTPDLGDIPLPAPGPGGSPDRRHGRGHAQTGPTRRRWPGSWQGKIGFLDIAEQVARAMDQVPVVQRPTLEDILEADRAARAPYETRSRLICFWRFYARFCSFLCCHRGTDLRRAHRHP